MSPLNQTLWTAIAVVFAIVPPFLLGRAMPRRCPNCARREQQSRAQHNGQQAAALRAVQTDREKLVAYEGGVRGYIDDRGTWHPDDVPGVRLAPRTQPAPIGHARENRLWLAREAGQA